jgi:beta-N-acetylhexosaminidase
LLVCGPFSGQGGEVPSSNPVPFLTGPTPWADSLIRTLSPKERIGQLIMVPAWSNKGIKHAQEMDALVREHHIGGLIFFQGGPMRQLQLTERYQRAARTPLLVGMDLEWGLAMRLDSTMKFPRQMALGALQNDTLIERMGLEIARQMRRLGVHVSFSPVVDVNNNPRNPVINDRSFGEDREAVARKGIAYMRGLQSGGVLATAKHFPGHGDTDMDSHHSLPIIPHDRARLDSLELYPFRRLVDQGLAAVMVAHLQVPALDDATGVPSSLSRPTVRLLEEEMGFKGLIFTDALNMEGAAGRDKPGVVELRALLAGNDVLLYPTDPIKAIEHIQQAVDSGRISQEEIDRRCLKVLRAKEWAGLARPFDLANKGLHADLHTASAEQLRRELYREAITVVRNSGDLLPIADLSTRRIASLAIGAEPNEVFQSSLSRHARVDHFTCDKVLERDSMMALLGKLDGYDLVIASVHKTNSKVDKEFGIPAVAMELLRRVVDHKPTIFALFANPYRLQNAFGLERSAGLLVAYEENDATQDLMAQVIFGAHGANGRLPVTASEHFKCGAGVSTRPLGRLRYDPPETVGVPTVQLEGIDAIVQEGLRAEAYPGCQVVVSKNGQVVWNKAYGHPAYGDKASVRTDDLYDLASITKVAATTFCLMHLVDAGSVSVDSTLGTYLPELLQRSPAHARMALRDVLTHQAGLRAFVPFYKNLMKEGKFLPGATASAPSAQHNLRVADGLYLHETYRDSVWKWVLDTPVGKRGSYLYSDMGYYFLQRIVERLAKCPLDAYADSVFYKPLGLGLRYTPWKNTPLQRLMPTEMDLAFRGRQLRGDVHDPGAAMLGGVAGHAGLFGSANDLAVLMQLLLDRGVYAGKRYLSPEVVADFTRCQYCGMATQPAQAHPPPPVPRKGKRSARKAPVAAPVVNRRGLGFDKPAPNGGDGPTCDCVSMGSFGHTGFTGTMVWADPATRSTYVFLSNRVYPDARNKKLTELGIRTRIQAVVAAAMGATP